MNLKIGLLFLTGMVACMPDHVSTERELMQFVQDEDNGLKQTADAANIHIVVLNKPQDLLVAQELRNESIEPKTLADLREKYSTQYYFMLSLSSGDKEVLTTRIGMAAYSELVQTLSFDMASYVTLTTDSDTIPVTDFMLNRTFDMSRTTDLLFIFSKQKTVGKDWVQFNLNEFGLKTGNQRFRFSKKDLDSAPTINFITAP